MAEVKNTPVSFGRRVYPGLDVWRGIAALWVVAHHASQFETDRNPALLQNPLFKFFSLGYLGVEIFFVISGYCIASACISNLLKGQGITQYAKARVRRIYPTYWFACALFLIVGLLIKLLVTKGIAPAEALNNPLVQAIYSHSGWRYVLANVVLAQFELGEAFFCFVAWTLCYEIAFYIVCGVAKMACGRFGTGVFLNSLHLLTVVCSVLSVIAAYTHHSLVFPFDMWPMFGLGVLVFDLLCRTTNEAKKAFSFSALVALGVTTASLLVYAFLPNATVGLVQHPSAPSIAITLMFVAVLLFLHRWDDQIMRTGMSRFFAKIGLFSYSLYLTHLCWIHLVSSLFRVAHLSRELYALQIAVSITLSVLLAWGFFQLCEKPFLGQPRKKQESQKATTKENAVSAALSPRLPPRTALSAIDAQSLDT